jgi:hypothetical protein
MRGLRFLLLPVLLLAVNTPSAHGDDWPQFRRDANRSAASRDSLRFPLQPLWTWETKARTGHTPLYHAVVSRNNVYFTASDKGQRFLVCADAKTGKVVWSRALDTEKLDFVLSDVAGPAVTESGLVYVYDWMTQSDVKSRNGIIHLGQGASSSGIVEPANSFCVRVFNAVSGKEAHLLPLAVMGANGILPRLSLTETTEDEDGQEVNPVPPTFVGCPP